MEWRDCADATACSASIHAYVCEIQIRIEIPGATGYLHLRCHRSGYFLLLAGTVIAVQACGKRGVTNKTINVNTNLSIKTIQRNVADDGSNHRANCTEHFEMERELRNHCREFGLTLVLKQVPTNPKCMPEAIDLLTNPTSVVSLMYQGTVTHRFQTILHDLPCSALYKAYLCPKYALTPVWDRINWIALGWARCQSGQLVVTISKYLHGWLSLCSELERHGKFRRATCPFCDECKTTAHLFRCKEPTQHKVIQHTMLQFWSKCDEILLPSLCAALRQSFNQWQRRRDDIEPDNHIKAISEQETIGWDQFIRGRIAISFPAIQEDALRRKSHRNPVYAAGMKMVMVIQEILQCSLFLWNHRNKRAHQTDGEIHALHTQELHAQVHAMYQLSHCLHPEIQSQMFRVPVAEMVKKSHSSLKIWLGQVRMLLLSHPACNPYKESHVTDYFTSTARPPGSHESFLSSQILLL